MSIANKIQVILDKLQTTLNTKGAIKQVLENNGITNIPFEEYPAQLANIVGGGAIPLAEYDMSAAQDNSVIAYMEAVPAVGVRVRIEGTGEMRDYGLMLQSPFSGNDLIKEIIIADGKTSIAIVRYELH